MDLRTVVGMLLVGVMLPFVASWAIGWVAWRDRRLPVADASIDRRRSAVTGLLAIVATVALVQCLLVGVPSLPPREALHWVPLAMLGGFLIGWLPPVRLVNFGGALLLAACCRLEPWFMAPLLWSVTAIAWQVLGRLSGRGWSVVSVGTHLAACALVLVATGNLRLSQLAVAGAMASLGLLVVQLSRPRLTLAAPVASGVAALSTALLAQGVAYGDTPRWAGFAMGAAAPLGAVALARFVGRRWWGVVLIGAMMLATGAIVAAVNVEPE